MIGLSADFVRNRMINPEDPSSSSDSGSDGSSDSGPNSAIPELLSTLHVPQDTQDEPVRNFDEISRKSPEAAQAMNNFQGSGSSDYDKFKTAVAGGNNDDAVGALTHAVETGKLGHDDAVTIALALKGTVERRGEVIDGDHASEFDQAVGGNAL